MGARLIVFPETFIPTYPDWVWRAAAWDGPFEALTARLREQSVEVPSSATEELGRGREAREGLRLGRRERARRRHDLQRAAALRSRRRDRGEASEADADRRRTARLGPRRRVRPRSRRHAVRTRRRADLLGEHDAARADRDLREGRRHLDGADVGQRRELDREPPPHRARGTRLRDRRVHAAPRLGHPRRHPGPGALGRRGRLGQPGMVGHRRPRRPAARRSARRGGRASSPPRSTPRSRGRSGTGSIPSATTAGPTCSRWSSTTRRSGR